MTNEQLRKIDALIAEHLMGYKKELEDRYCIPIYNRNPGSVHSDEIACDEYRPTENIEQAWEITEKFPIYFRVVQQNYDGIIWKCYLHEEDISQRGYAEARTAPLAICLAVLMARRIKYD